MSGAESPPDSGRAWVCRGRRLEVFHRVHVMGILNVTPDSFSDGGLYLDRDAAIKRGIEMTHDGADIIDVGGESTRPGAEAVGEAEERRRVVSVIQRLSKEVDIPISIDTTKATVAEAAIEAGAVIINDVSALRADPRMLEVAWVSGAGIVLMHMQGNPRTMQTNPAYDDVVSEVRSALSERVEKAEAGGIGRERIAIDPGIGFGKTKEHNLELLASLESLTETGYPVLVGPSRKSFIGATLGDLPPAERLEGTAAAVGWCAAHGANVIRVHDVKEMVRVVRMTTSIGGHLR